MKKEGFTLLELLVALVLISLLAAIAIPVYFGRGEVTLENAAILLAKDLRAAQNRSAFLSETTMVEPLAHGDGYRIMDSDGLPVDNPLNQLPFERRYSVDGVFRGVVVSAFELGPDGRLAFDERGMASESGHFTLRYGDDERTVLITAPHGQIQVLGSTSGWIDRGY